MPPADPSAPAHGAAAARPTVMVIHGPNLDLLGTREPDVYGTTTLPELDRKIVELGATLGVVVEAHQTNGEGAFIELLHRARGRCAGVIVNPGGYTHTSVAIHDALRAVDAPVVEVHLSNLYAREPIRHGSITGAACRGVVMGLGQDSYLLALRHLAARIHASVATPEHA
ncbi:MAG TPA: type II 3-dehydroquinate dehydratase [Nannocystaceae bacterium]|nr:type II 3-dehydroquinate dehydratase [Nannocystaceae bacterium]